MIRRTRVVATHEEPNTPTKSILEAPVIDITDDPIVLLGRTGGASVTVSVDTKLSEFEYWGMNTFDRVPYTVGSFCSITLPCDVTTEKLNEAKQLAQQHAFEGAYSALHYALPKHVMHIRQLYSSNFPDHKCANENNQM